MKDLFQFPDEIPQDVNEISNSEDLAIQKGKILIAEFMNYDLASMNEGELQFDKSIENLTPVLKKIELLNSYVVIQKNKSLIHCKKPLRSFESEGGGEARCAFGVCVMFIEWINKIKSSPPLEIRTRDRYATVNHNINSIKKHR